VLDDNGAVRVNADGSPFTSQSLYEEFAASHLWSIKGRVLSGAGSTPSVAPPPSTYDVAKLFGPGSVGNSAEVNRLSIQRPELYKKLRAEAKARNLVV
jgi:hypothetical protein